MKTLSRLPRRTTRRVPARRPVAALIPALVALVGCGDSGSIREDAAPASGPGGSPADTVVIEPGETVQTRVQEELILAQPGTVIQFEEGLYEFTDGLSLDVDGVTVRGRGMDKTVFSFKNQEAGAEGFYITSDRVLVEDLAIEDTKGNGLKSHTANDIVLRRVRVEWTGRPKETNGAYAIYPVKSENVLVEECVAIGGSDSGVYVGQSKNIVVRNCTARFNVAGIEIENCHGADVYGNTATRNTGGILVFDLPDLPQQRGRDIRLFNNNVFDNNTPNFAPKGNIVASVPTGTGIMVMANSNVEVFDNEVRDHGTTNTMVVSYLGAGIKIKDPNYYPFPERIHIHDNTFGPAGDKPAGENGRFMASVLGTPLPDIIWDGAVNPEKLADGSIPAHADILITGNTKDEGGEITFGNVGGVEALQDPENASPSRDLGSHTGSLPPVEPVVLESAGPAPK